MWCSCAQNEFHHFNELRSYSRVLAILAVALPSPWTRFLCGPFCFSFNLERSRRSPNVFSFSLRFTSALRFFVCERCRDAAFSATFIFLLQQHIITVIKLQQPVSSMKSRHSVECWYVKASCLLKRPLMNGKDKVIEFRVLCCGFPKSPERSGREDRKARWQRGQDKGPRSPFIAQLKHNYFMPDCVLSKALNRGRHLTLISSDLFILTGLREEIGSSDYSQAWKWPD